MRRTERAPTRDPEQAEVDHEAGSAVVEFLGVSLLLLVPVVYLVVVLAHLQAATFAVDGAAREAARAYTTAQDTDQAQSRAVSAVALALGDQGLDPAAAPGAVGVVCSTTCLEPGSDVTVTVDVEVPLPGVPGSVRGVVPLAVPVSAVATGHVDTFAGAGDE
ncbi:pilus assembly protein [Actinotalea sp. BY-33]|uniref:Pilus assembly protein n=1 Tax=Actinotalea soli TaxID=2819234 RepID=A0A939LRI3_9CELL|nr:pilus assembly protein [Actinotalea soli]MBO1751730.1 pilus assembly protein [Actinotalea soli]